MMSTMRNNQGLLISYTPDRGSIFLSRIRNSTLMRITDHHSLTVPGFCAIVRQSTRTIAILYDTVL
jgi:hypothetical protein